MKIIILHGDDSPRRYNRLQAFISAAKSRKWKIQRVGDSASNIREVLISDTLFDEKRFVLVEDYKLLDKKTLKWLKDKKDSLDLTLVIYHKDSLGKTFLKSLPQIDKEEEYKLPKLIWSFLETFYPGNSKNVIKVLHKIVEKEPVEFVFSLLSKQLRDLYWVKMDPKTMPYPSWRIGRLKSQASKFTEEQLAELISEFAEIDIKSKTSQDELIDLLDFAIATKLE